MNRKFLLVYEEVFHYPGGKKRAARRIEQLLEANGKESALAESAARWRDLKRERARFFRVLRVANPPQLLNPRLLEIIEHEVELEAQPVH